MDRHIEIIHFLHNDFERLMGTLQQGGVDYIELHVVLTQAANGYSGSILKTFGNKKNCIYFIFKLITN